MNMKTSSKLSSVKRVYVSIREQPKVESSKSFLQPKPPSQPARFIRKRQDRCHTPEQVTSTKEKPPASTKFIYHRSLSPYVPPKENSYNNFCVPKESSSLLPVPAPVIEKDDDLCLPYELSNSELFETAKMNQFSATNVKTRKVEVSEDKKSQKVENFEKVEKIERTERPEAKEKVERTEKGGKVAKSEIVDRVRGCRAASENENSDQNEKSMKIEGRRSKRSSVRGLCKNLDLNKKVLTKAQLLVQNPGESRERRESISSNLPNDENTTVASRTPSPNISQRNNRCQALSKNFKIKREGFVSEVEKQARGKSAEKEAENPEPWVNILKDLDNGITIKDLPSFQSYQNSRVSVKLRRDCK